MNLYPILQWAWTFLCGNYSDNSKGRSYGQLVIGSFIMTKAPTHASRLMQSFVAKRQITQVTQPDYSLDLAPCDFWLFPKLKLPLKGKRFQTVDEIQENMTGQLMSIGRTVWGPKVPTLKGIEVSLSFVQCFLYLVPSSVNASIFLFLKRFYLLIFLEKGGGREKDRGRNTDVWLFLTWPQLGTWPATQACALGIKPVTLSFAGWHSVLWATPARENASIFHSIWLDVLWTDLIYLP